MPKKQSQLAKLTRPRLHKAVARERLFALLDEAREHKPAICVVGPPGAGKTTLVASWLDARAIKGIWYQVDPGDADLATYFYYLGEAARPYQRKGQRPLPRLTPEYLADVEGFSRRFFRELFARLPEGATLVLDNYQEVSIEQFLHEIVSQSIEEIPPGVTLIAISRRDLPDCYTRRIANENLALIEWPDLRLTPPEAQAIAAEKGQANADLVGVMRERADGWAAGLTLLLERTHAPDARTPESHESYEAIFDYFAAEILSRIDEETRKTLLATAWLPTVSTTVAAALTGSVRVETIFEDLYRRHLFVHRRVGGPPTYQYHALFRRYLQMQARKEFDAQTLVELKARTARLLEQSGDVEAAIELYCDDSVWVDAVRLIVARAPQLLDHGRGGTLKLWTARLPVDLLSRTPWLNYWLGVSMFANAPSVARGHLRQALQMFTPEKDALGRILSLAGIIESHWAEFSGDDDIEECLETALSLLGRAPRFPDAETELRVLSVLHAAMLLRKPRSPTIESTRDRIVSLLFTKLSDDAKLLGGGALLAEALQTGHLALADRLISTMGALAESIEVSPVARFMWMLRLPMYFTHKADYERARDVLDYAQALIAEEGIQIGRGYVYYTGAFDSIVADDLATAERYVERLEETQAVSNRLLYRDLSQWLRCVIALARGDAPKAAALGMTALAGARARQLTWPIVWFGVATIFALIETGDHEEAAVEIDALREFIRGTFMEHFEVELLFAEAYLAFKKPRREQVSDLLGKAWLLARERDFIFGYRSAFRAHRVMFSESLRLGIEPDYVKSVIRRFKLRPEDATDEHWPWPVKVQTLGRFAVLLDDQPLAYGRKVPRKPLLLLKALIAFGEYGVSEKRLTDALWPDDEGDGARHALALALHRLRRLLANPEAITVSDGVLGLNRDLVWTDVRAFEALLEREDSGSAEFVASLLRFYRGSFLAEDVDEPWTVSTRERLRSRFLNAVDRAGAVQEEAGRFDEATALYLRGLDADPLAEMFYQGLMRCYARQGRHAEAISTYRRLRQTLSVVLGVSPSPGTEALVRELRA